MHRRPILAAVLAAAALALPGAAQAQPADMHASTALALAAQRAHGQTQQDLRSPDTRDAATRPVPPAGQPTWPVDPQPIVAPAPEPAVDGGGSDVPVVPIVAGGLLVLLAALIARPAARRVGRGTRVAV